MVDIVLELKTPINQENWNDFRKENGIESKEESEWLYKNYKPKMLFSGLTQEKAERMAKGEDDEEEEEKKPFIEDFDEEYYFKGIKILPEVKGLKIVKLLLKFDINSYNKSEQFTQFTKLIKLLSKIFEIQELNSSDLFSYYLLESNYFPELNVVYNNKDEKKAVFLESFFKGVILNLMFIEQNDLENKFLTRNGTFDGYAYKMDINVKKVKSNSGGLFIAEILSLIEICFEEIKNSIKFNFAVKFNKKFSVNHYEYNFTITDRKTRKAPKKK